MVLYLIISGDLFVVFLFRFFSSFLFSYTILITLCFQNCLELIYRFVFFLDESMPGRVSLSLILIKRDKNQRLFLHRPIRPIDNVKNQEHHGEAVTENAVHSSKPLFLVDFGNLILPLVELRPLEQKAVFRVNHSQAFPLFSHLEPFLDLKIIR